MRRPLLAIAVTFALASPASAAEIDGARDAGVPQEIAATPAEGRTDDAATHERGTAEGATNEGLPGRLGKAAVFGLVASALLLAGGVWRRGRGRRLPRPR
ncbi:MAG: hypothetical protein KF850_21785 [Labilithrix sp.]|nr:hypothetical protein [Labilithrix sp.]